MRFSFDPVHKSENSARKKGPAPIKYPGKQLPGTKGFGQTVIAKRVFLFAVAGLLWCTAAVAEPAGSFPRPPELEPDILFWTRVYTEVDTRGGLIHDSSRLGVVYEVLRFPEGVGRRTQRRLVKAAKRRYKNILLELARGKRENLTVCPNKRVRTDGDRQARFSFCRCRPVVVHGCRGRARGQLSEASGARAGHPLLDQGVYGGGYPRRIDPRQQPSGCRV